MQFLAGQFGVDVLGFAVMSNHLHVVLRNRPDIIHGWSDDEVARRWWNVFPKRRDREGNAKEPSSVELQMIMIDPAKRLQRPNRRRNRTIQIAKRSFERCVPQRSWGTRRRGQPG